MIHLYLIKTFNVWSVFLVLWMCNAKGPCIWHLPSIVWCKIKYWGVILWITRELWVFKEGRSCYKRGTDTKLIRSLWGIGIVEFLAQFLAHHLPLWWNVIPCPCSAFSPDSERTSPPPPTLLTPVWPPLPCQNILLKPIKALAKFSPSLSHSATLSLAWIYTL